VGFPNQVVAIGRYRWRICALLFFATTINDMDRSVVGGWTSSRFIKRGWSVNRARKTTPFICALSILPVMFVTMIGTKFNADARF